MSQQCRDGNIENILRIDAELALEELDAALVAFWLASAARPNGGGTKHMEDAAARKNVALQNFNLARRQLNEFVRDGKLPEHT